MDIQKRRRMAVTALYDLSRRGTLWLVLNTVWKRVSPSFVIKPDRDGGPGYHAGLALGKRNLSDADTLFPMLVGTSKRSGASLELSAVFAESDEEAGKRAKRKTYFAIRPFKVTLDDFFSEDGRRQITPLPSKSRLTDDELRRFNGFLMKYGLRL